MCASEEIKCVTLFSYEREKTVDQTTNWATFKEKPNFAGN